jgi:hypothetical protein
MDLFTVQRVLWVASVTAEVLLIAAIIQRRLAGRYPFFLAYLIVEAASVLLLLHIDYRSISYAYAWRWYRAALLVLRLGAAGELFELVSQHFRAIRRFRFYLAAILLAFAGLLAWVALRPLDAGVSNYPQTLVMLIERWETTALEIALILTWWFLAVFMQFPFALRKNVAAHWIVLTIYFGIDSLFTALALIGGSLTARIAQNLALLVGELGCFVVWLCVMRQDGETAPVVRTVTADELAYGRALRRWILEHIQEARG